MKRFLFVFAAVLAVLALTVSVFAADEVPQNTDADAVLLITAADTNSDDDLGGAFSGARLALAGKVTLIGLLIVFSSLAVIWGALEVFHLFTKKTVSKTAAAAPAADSQPAPIVPSNTDDLQLIAVITAAVAAYRASENSCGAASGGFRVVSFKKVGHINK